MSDAPKAVFLSYASQDAEAAKKICDALRAAGVEVWFDQSELRGGDAWDALIRKRIKECSLFVPVISANTQARAEGYFRLEWKLAVDRSHLMADDAAFLFPIVIGDVTDATARVPDKFKEVQWTRLRLDETPAELAARVAKLLSGSALEAGRPRPAEKGSDFAKASTDKEGTPSPKNSTPSWLRYAWAGVGLVFALVYALRPLWQPARIRETAPALPPHASGLNPAAVPQSEARKLAEKARALFDKIDSNADDFAVAESLLKRALELDATDGEIWAYSARLNAAYLTRSFERGTGRAEAARNHAERAVKLAPESAEAWHALGRAIWRSDPPRAEEALRHALQLAPDDGHILISLGSIYRNQGRDEDALAFYVRAAAQPAVRPLALYDQFLIHLYLRRFAEADRCGREAAAALPTTNSITGLAMLEIVWHGRLDAAQRTLDAAPAALRSEPRMVFAAALAALMAKQTDEALRALDRLPGDFINDAWYSGPKALLVGLAHAQAGRPEAARIAWEAGLAVVHRRLQDTPNDSELHLRLGELLAWTGQAEPALREARVFEELARNRTDWTFSSARIYAALGRADAALPILEKFLTATATGRWPLTPALLRLDPIWDKLRDDVRFQKLIIDHTPPRDWPKDPELKRVTALLDRTDNIPEDFRLAEQLAQQALDKAPTDPETVTVMARVHSMWLLRGWDRSTARYQKAKSTAERALQLAPDEPEAHAALAMHLYTRGSELPRALELAQRAVDLAPQEPRFHRLRDNCLFTQGFNAADRFSDYSVERSNPALEKALESSRRTVELFPQDALVRYELTRHYRDLGRWAEFERLTDETLALAPVANAIVWEARAQFGLHGDLTGMKATLDQVPARVRGIERTVFGYFLYAAYTGNTRVGLDALDGMTESWMIDFDYRGPKALPVAALLELAGKKELARIQYEAAAAELQRARGANPDDTQNYLVEAWIQHGLGKGDAARAALRTFNESIARPFTTSPMGTWWFQPIPANLVMGERATALALIREATASYAEGRATIRQRLAADPRMAPFRDDPEIKALLAEPEAKK
ncbi:MAG: TIR domain-containing protein [Lacunisphaera sp.]|nr:TIR domain-containing protein [Lacunisphaera sp.]